MLETLLFYAISLALVIFAIGVVASRSAVYSVLSLVAAMGMMAGLFILLKAFLVATILILVYAGAILVLFLFVVMLIDFKKESFALQGFKLSPAVAVFLSGMIFWQTFHVINTIPAQKSLAVDGTTEAISHLLFSRYLFPFEL